MPPVDVREGRSVIMSKERTFVCSPERRRKIYRAAATRLQQFADKHPDIRHDLETPEIALAIRRIDELLMLFLEAKCERAAVSDAFDQYEQALIKATMHPHSTEEASNQNEQRHYCEESRTTSSVVAFPTLRPIKLPSLSS